METSEINPSDVFGDTEQRRLSQNRANLPAPMVQPGVPRHHEEASVQRPTHVQPPSQAPPSHSGVPPSHSSAPLYSQAPPSLHSASPDNAAILQMLNLCQQQMAQQQQQMAQQQLLINEFLHQRTLNQSVASPSIQPEQIIDYLSHAITEFRYEKEVGVTFGNWFARYTDLFQKDAARIDDSAKVRLLMRKLGAAEHDRYLSFILPSRPSDLSLEDTVAKLTALFDCQESLLSRRFKCLQLAKKRTEDHLSYACRINKACVEFELGKLNEDEFKTLLFVCGLKDETEADLRTRLLARIEDGVCTTLQQVSMECSRLVNLKKDSAMIETPVPERVLAVNTKAHRPFQRAPSQHNVPKSPCWLCGGLHWMRDCTYRSHRCKTCGRTGHKEGHCKTASRRKADKHFGTKQRRMRVSTVNVHSVQQRRRFVLIKLNGTTVRLQLDTASDITVIDRTTWKRIGKPHLAPSTVVARTASGENLSLDGEFVCNVSVADQTQRVTISVTQGRLLLMGSDLIEKFALWSMPMDSFCCQVRESYQPHQK